jgi:hypothetical protein
MTATFTLPQVRLLRLIGKDSLPAFGQFNLHGCISASWSSSLGLAIVYQHGAVLATCSRRCSFLLFLPLVSG